MEMEKREELFKEWKTINQKTKQEENLKELNSAIKENRLRNLLFGRDSIPCGKDDKEHKPNHNGCEYNNDKDSQRETEKRMCRCMYYCNKKLEKCKECNYEWKWVLEESEEFKIEDYETPSSYVMKKIGGVDLLIEEKVPVNGKKYAVEVKPKRSSETIVRMLAEILTYTLDKNFEAYTPAICFFEYKDQKEHSEQWKQMKKLENNDDLRSILEVKGIEVFYFTHVIDESDKTINKFRINRYPWK